MLRKKVIAIIVGLCLTINVVPTSLAAINSKAEDVIQETIVDADGNQIYFEISFYENGSSQTDYYVNNELTETTYINSLSGEISVVKHNGNTQYAPVIENYALEDFVKTSESESDFIRSAFDFEIPIKQNSVVDPEWAFYGTIPATPFLTGSKPTDLYFMLFDQEPDYERNRFDSHYISFKPGDSASVVAAALGYFVRVAGAGAVVTVGGLISACGIAIAGTLVKNYFNSEICLSTQRVLYFPVIENQLVFKDAYLDRLWVVIDESTDGFSKVELANPYYRGNRGQTPENIAVNAQWA